MIFINNIVDIGAGRKQCRVVLDEDYRAVDGFVPAGEYDPFIYDPDDRFGLSPIVRAKLAELE